MSAARAAWAGVRAGEPQAFLRGTLLAHSLIGAVFGENATLRTPRALRGSLVQRKAETTIIERLKRVALQ